MKFFGWGRRKDPPPTQPAYQELKKSDHFSNAARSAQRPETEGYETEFVEQEDHVQSHVTPAQERFALAWPLKYFSGEGGDVGSETWEERLQETIRFVFSHEQEGLLTIGTFALDQLAGVTNLDGSQIKPPTNDLNSISSMQQAILEVRSSDDEINLQQSILRSPIPAPACRRNLESYPIFGDHDAPISCQLVSSGSTKPVDTGSDLPYCTDSANAKPHAVAGIKQVALSTTLDSEVFDKSDSEDFYSPSACSLFASRSRRVQKSVKESEQKKPPEKRKGDGGSYELKRTGSCKGSLGAQLGRLWRSGCTRSVSTKVTPEKKLTSYHRESQAQGPPCIANVEEAAAGIPQSSQASEVGKQRKRKSHSFGKGWPCAHNGKWIRTDSEFVVLEM